MKYYKGTHFSNCDICGVSSELAPILLRPTSFIFGKSVINLAHEGKFVCCDCLHDELVVLGGEENAAEK